MSEPDRGGPACACATGAVLPVPTRCQREDEDGPCIVQAESCTCRVPFDCAEDYPGCCFCAHMDTYHPCPTFGFGCGPGCDCCTPYQQRQVFRQSQPRLLSVTAPCPVCGRTDPPGGLRPVGHPHAGMCVSAAKCLTIQHDAKQAGARSDDV